MNKVKIGFPVEYEDENNIARNGLFLREPEIKELKKRLKEINRIIDLKQQCKKQKEVIDKAKSLNHEISHTIYEDFLEENIIGSKFLYERIKKQLSILEDKEVSE